MEGTKRIERLEELTNSTREHITTLKERVAALEREAQERQKGEQDYMNYISEYLESSSK